MRPSFKPKFLIIVPIMTLVLMVCGNSLLLTINAAEPQSSGLLDDGRVRLPSDYTNWTPPEKGTNFSDSVYGTTITRLTNGLAQFGGGVYHEYSTMCPFNRDNTRILLLSANGGFFITDLRGNVIIDPDGLRIGGRQEPRWSITDPNVFFFHEDNMLRKFDLNTREKTTIRTFSQFSSINFGGGESDISDDGNHIVIAGDRNIIGVYEFSTDRLGATIDVTDKGSYDSFDMTPNNNVFVRWNSDGTGRYQGIELFDGNMNFIRQVAPFGAHADRARDLNGEEVLLIAAYNDNSPPQGCEINGVEKIKLSDGSRTCLVGFDFNAEVHVSVNNSGGHPWVLISVIDTSLGTANPFNTLPSDWPSRWKPRNNELILAKLDGKEVRRIAHHRSRVIGQYWFQPRAALSRDGNFALFDSNFGINPTDEYADVFLAQLKNNPTSTVSSATYRQRPLAPDSIVSVFGSSLAADFIPISTPSLPTELGGIGVKIFDSSGLGRPAPLFYVSPTQLNYLMPSGLAPGQAQAIISNINGASSNEILQIDNVAPGLYSADASGKGMPVGFVIRGRADGSQLIEPFTRYDPVLNQFVPIPINLDSPTDNVFLVLYGTGFRNRSSLTATSLKVGGIDAPLSFAGAQGFFIGLDQLNAMLPRALRGRGTVDLTFMVDGQTANALQISIK